MCAGLRLRVFGFPQFRHFFFTPGFSKPHFTPWLWRWHFQVLTAAPPEVTPEQAGPPDALEGPSDRTGTHPHGFGVHTASRLGGEGVSCVLASKAAPALLQCHMESHVRPFHRVLSQCDDWLQVYLTLVEK